MPKDLTPRQQDVFNFIASYEARHLCTPTNREIGTSLRLASPRSVTDHLRGLESAGWIAIRKGKHRGIQILIREEDKRIPVYGKVAAGSPLEAAENITRKVPLPKGLFRRDPDFFLEVSGDSMVDLQIFDGDLAAFKRTHTAGHGDIVVAMVNLDEMSRDERKRCGVGSGGLTLKKIATSGNRILLKSANREKGYEPFSLDPEMVRIEGKYLGCVRAI